MHLKFQKSRPFQQILKALTQKSAQTVIAVAAVVAVGVASQVQPMRVTQKIQMRIQVKSQQMRIQLKVQHLRAADVAVVQQAKV